jgi:hypothetical protein
VITLDTKAGALLEAHPELVEVAGRRFMTE